MTFMKQMNHNYLNIEKEQRYISDLLRRGYVLQKVNHNLYTFEENKSNNTVCKVILIHDSNFELIEKINTFVENEEIERVEAWIKKENKIVMYLYTDDKKKLDFLESDVNCVITEFREKINMKTKTMLFAMVFVAIFIVVSPWIATIELVIGIWCFFDISKCKKYIKKKEK